MSLLLALAGAPSAPVRGGPAFRGPRRYIRRSEPETFEGLVEVAEDVTEALDFEVQETGQREKAASAREVANAAYLEEWARIRLAVGAADVRRIEQEALMAAQLRLRAVGKLEELTAMVAAKRAADEEAVLITLLLAM